MKRALIGIHFLASIFCALQASSQEFVAVKTNLLYSAVGFTPNVGAEFAINDRTTIDLSASYNWFNLSGARNNNKKQVHWMVKPEFRYFLNERLDKRFNGHFFGVHALYTQYNIGGHSMPMLFGKQSDQFRHEGFAYGTGVSYGYLLQLAKRWAVEFDLGLGYMRMKYDKYACQGCGQLYEKGKTKNYFGPTQAGISVVFLIN